MLTKTRKYGLGIWALGLGYYLSYTPYSGLTKALSTGLLTGALDRLQDRCCCRSPRSRP